jgi:hypothetical protein
MSAGIALMKINHFRDMYVAELQELVSVESQLSDALLRMAGAAAHPALKDLLLDHRGETARGTTGNNVAKAWRQPSGTHRPGHAGPRP